MEISKEEFNMYTGYLIRWVEEREVWVGKHVAGYGGGEIIDTYLAPMSFMQWRVDSAAISRAYVQELYSQEELINL